MPNEDGLNLNNYACICPPSNVFKYINTLVAESYQNVVLLLAKWKVFVNVYLFKNYLPLVLE